MFKSINAFLLLLLVSTSLLSQNLQLHFDPRHAFHSKDFERNVVTATFEMFKPDKYGSTFMFTDFDFNQSRGNIGLIYMEIYRDQNLGDFPIKAHVEFNGGYMKDVGSIPNAYLAGAAYPFHIGKFFFNTYAAYKYNAFEKISNDVQWTLIWNASFFNNKFSVSGFFDFWTENKHREKANWKSGKKVIIISEPQFWYNVDEHLSFGSEIEISHNFLKNKNLEDASFVNPTVAVKWNF